MNAKTETEKTEQPAADTHTVTLDEPIKRGKEEITSITLRKPKSGALRGVSLIDIAQLDVAALQRVLPRISSPTLTEQDVANMEPADLMQLGTAVAGFLLRKADRQTAFPST